MRYKLLLLLLGIVVGIGAIGALVLHHYWDRIVEYELPKEKLNFGKLRPSSSVEIADSNGRIIEYVAGEHHQIYRPLGEISKTLQKFVIMLEDAKFYQHNGFDVESIKDSIEDHYEEGKKLRGGSTITQQLAKNMFLDKSRSLLRKLFEVPWTFRIEKDLKKNQILELYLNIIEWGPGIYGAEAASRHYFDKPASQLDVGQAMYLALIIPNPPRFDLFAHPARKDFLETKKKWLVERLVNEKDITPDKKEAYMSMDFGLVPPDAPNRKYPAFHSGDYFGRRDKPTFIQGLLKDNIREMAKLAGRGLTLHSSIDLFVQSELEGVSVVPGENPKPHYAVITEDGKVRAVRKLKANETLDSAGIESLATVDMGTQSFQNYEFEERDAIGPKDLL